jgi:hypothetical protein
MDGGASQKSAQSQSVRRCAVVAADFKVPFFDFFLHRPFSTVRDRRATTRDFAPRGLFESNSHDVLTSLLRHGRGSARDGM